MAKGGAFENEICKALSLWWTGGEVDDVFRRTQSSGGGFTRKAQKTTGKKTQLQSGDITYRLAIGEPLMREWSIECKTGYGSKTKKVVVDPKEAQQKREKRRVAVSIVNWCPSDALDGKARQTVFDRLWEQTYNESIDGGKRPVLIYRRPRMAPCIAISSGYADHLQSYFGAPDATTILYSKGGGEASVFIMGLEAFFAWIPDIREGLRGA